MAARGSVDAERELQLGVRDEAGGAFSHALEHYRACAEAAPASPFARAARGRTAWIEERSEGHFEPLAMLVRVRHGPSSLGDRATLARLSAEVEALPPGLVRSELRLRVGEAWLKLGGDRGEASDVLQRLLSDPTSGPADRRFGERDLVESLLAEGRLNAARDEVTAHPYDPSATAEVNDLLHRRRLKRATAGGFVAFLALAVVAAFLWRRRKSEHSEPLRSPSTDQLTGRFG